MTGGVNVRWRTAKGDELQIIANFAAEDVPMPKVRVGNIIWASSSPSDEAVRPDQVIVRRFVIARSAPRDVTPSPFFDGIPTGCFRIHLLVQFGAGGLDGLSFVSWSSRAASFTARLLLFIGGLWRAEA